MSVWSLKGQKILITAGGSGIGLETARLLIERGANVIICDIDEDALSRVPPGIPTRRVDVSDPGQVEEFVSWAAEKLGGIDGLVNNAGIAGPVGRTEQIDIDGWNRTLAVNLSGAFYASRYAIPYLRAAGGGSIVNLSSAAIVKGGFPLRVAYCVTKRGLLALTETLAMELGADNIRVNSILPGAVDNGRLKAVLQAQADVTGIEPAELLKAGLRQFSMQSVVSERDVAELIAFIMSGAGHLISGQAIGVCGNFEGHHSVNILGDPEVAIGDN